MAGTLVSLAVFGLLGSGCSRPGAPVQAIESPAESKRVLVVINQGSEKSRAIGDYYVRKRSIPSENVVRIDVSTTENISPDEYKYGIEEPVRKAIKRSKNAIDFIVTTKGVPLRLRDDSGYSVDAFLMAMNLPGVPPIEKIDRDSIIKSLNPYFNRNEPFSSAKFNMYLVCRLDGYEVEQIKKMIDNSLAAKPEKGPFFFDGAENRQDGGYLAMQKMLGRANDILKTKGFRSTFDSSPKFIAPEGPLMGYCSWGSNDSSFALDIYRRIRFRPGAIAETFVSTSGRTFSRTSGGQSLIADLIEQGVTGVKGYVSEPYTFALAKPDILFDRYTSGFNLAESFYMASQLIKWKDVVIGDPLCRPYGK